MRVRRTYLARVVQEYEGDPPPEWDMAEINEYSGELTPSEDQYVCDNWKLVSDSTEQVEEDDLESRVKELTT